jgi:serine/threonine-protein kinase
MDLQSGAKLGPYEIVSPIGKGGMGEVWKARDSRLNREVAIKTSRAGFGARFRRESQAVAALNHPRICTLYDVGPDYLVMEYIEGPTLAERISQGPIPLEEALGIAKQIADALEAAHEGHIVHRDLKPANIKIRPDGSVKVLDFGLAKTDEAAELTGDSPTLTAGTQPGMILGTAGYMSPEQARGQVVDKRADIWAFGVVLHEMLTGQRLFEGDSMSDTLVSVLTKEPEWNRVPAKAQRPILRGNGCSLIRQYRPPLETGRASWTLLGDFLGVSDGPCAFG